MKALIFDGSLKLMNDYPVPEPSPDEALIRVALAGICNTDLEIMNGYLKFSGIIGHEFVGVVEMARGKGKRWIGKRVVGDINCSCNSCEFCLGGLAKHCPSRETLGILGRGGSFAEYVTLPVRNLHEVPKGLADEEAVFAEPLAAAFEILERISVNPSCEVLVLGDGKLGILCALVLGLKGAKVTLAGKYPRKMAIVAGQGIQSLATNSIGGGKRFDIVVEATGNAAGFEDAVRFVKARGTIVLKSTVAKEVTINLAPLVIDEITVVGSRCGPFEPALKALADGLIDVTPLVSGVFPLTEAKQAFAAAKRRNTLKVLFDLRSQS